MNLKQVSTILFFTILSAISLFASGNKEEGVIMFAGSGGYPPFNFITESNEVDGFDVDVAKEIAKRLDLELEYVTTAWDGIIEGLRASRYNGILGSMAVTEEREKIVDFTTPYYYSGAQIITKKDSNIKSLEDIDETTTIAVVTGTTFVKDVDALGANVRMYEDDNQTLMELLNGRVDAVITDRVVGLNAMKQIKGGEDLKLTGELLRKEECAIALKKGDDLLDEINKILMDMRGDGTLKKISNKWFEGSDITVP
ncbi:transporter substrate-binding domain-containing protein [Thiospirochaeta perfilievii]|uniref:Transporter substrate-binding domain-containing protein n=1 Tax=Thiospirochaeta perfilievii TaxID=252967 RepID=A0A5C1Q7T8_9SPIO|nr:ABC transporter substrate-binding protein [Thiospirochaeta perfilievii]QEN04095.1 transporter substrate-binding domain-containing protein [Thiospirochaeta perfilievii]